MWRFLKRVFLVWGPGLCLGIIYLATLLEPGIWPIVLICWLLAIWLSVHTLRSEGTFSWGRNWPIILLAVFWPFLIFWFAWGRHHPDARRHRPPRDLSVVEEMNRRATRGKWYYFEHDGHWYRQKVGAHGGHH